MARARKKNKKGLFVFLYVLGLIVIFLASMVATRFFLDRNTSQNLPAEQTAPKKEKDIAEKEEMKDTQKIEEEPIEEEQEVQNTVNEEPVKEEKPTDEIEKKETPIIEDIPEEDLEPEAKTIFEDETNDNAQKSESGL